MEADGTDLGPPGVEGVAGVKAGVAGPLVCGERSGIPASDLTDRGPWFPRPGVTGPEVPVSPGL